MKLHRIVINEKQGPIPYDLILGEIIRDGDVTNPYQLHVLVLLTQFFKDGVKPLTDLEPLLPYSNAATSNAAIEAIKSISPSDKVNLAQYLLDCISAGESALHSQHFSSSDWTRFVLRKNDQ